MHHHIRGHVGRIHGVHAVPLDTGVPGIPSAAQAAPAAVDVQSGQIEPGNGVARRPASDDDLQLMLLRTSKPVRIGRRGVTLKLHGLELDFYTPELVNMRMKEKVYVRYDPEDLSSVRVYDMEDRFLCVAPQNKLTAGYLENQEQIADLMAAKRRAEKAVREYGAALRLPDDPDRALTLATALAQRNLDALDTFPSPKLIQLQQSAREEPLLKAVGDIDIGRMNENIIRQRGGIEDGKDL